MRTPSDTDSNVEQSKRGIPACTAVVPAAVSRHCSCPRRGHSPDSGRRRCAHQCTGIGCRHSAALQPLGQHPAGKLRLAHRDQRTRSQEGVGDLDLSEAAFDALPLDQQLFTVVNDERIDRGLPPIDYITSQLDGYAQGGANGGTDPSFPNAVTGGAPITYGGSIWAGGLTSVLEADYYWMYDDGYSGSSTSNSACSLSSPSGCWAARDIILHQFANCPSGPPILSMGGAFSSDSSGGSIAAIFVDSCSPPTDITDSWSQLAFPRSSPARGRSPSRRRPTAPVTGRRRPTARSPRSAPPRTTAL